MANYSSKTILFDPKRVERYPYFLAKGESGESKEVITKVINEALTLKGIDWQYARARLYGSGGGVSYYTIEYWTE